MKALSRGFVSLVAILAAAFVSVLPCLGQCYQIIDIGDLAGYDSVASAINARGQSLDMVLPSHSCGARKWFQGLGTLGPDTSSYAYGINSAAQVVGTSRTSSGEFHAFLWSPDD